MPKKIAPLTARVVASAKPGEKQRKLFDGGGLFLLITPKGGRYWRLKYRFGNKEKTMALGVYPQTTLAKARRAADYARTLLQWGDDPMRRRKADKAIKAEVDGIVKRGWWTGELGVMASNALKAYGFSSKDEVLAAMNSGAIRIKSGSEGGGSTVPQLGEKGIAEVRAWLGLPNATIQNQASSIPSALSRLEEIRLAKWGRAEAMAYLREQGMTLRAVGNKMGVSAERVRAILSQRERMLYWESARMAEMREWLMRALS